MEFNLGLFATLLVAASVELVLCVIQMVNGLFGCICGTCGGKEVREGQGGRGGVRREGEGGGSKKESVHLTFDLYLLPVGSVIINDDHRL